MSSSPGKKTVLYVEDEENDIFLVEYGFKKANMDHPLKVARDGKEAIDYLSGVSKFANREENPLPALILLDINLPLVTGIEVLRWVREQAQFRDLPVIMFSSSEEPSDKHQAQLLGASAYVLKPADPMKYIELAQHLKRQWLSNEA